METLPQAASTSMQGVVMSAANITPEQVQPCDFSAVGGIDEARLAPLVTASEALAESCRKPCTASLGWLVKPRYKVRSKYLAGRFSRRPAVRIWSRCELGPQADIALLQVDSMLLFPIVDRLLGGSGEPSELSREVTESKTRSPRNSFAWSARNCKLAWQSFSVSVSLGARQTSARTAEDCFPPTTTRWFSAFQ